jgi:hypothetical protein
MSPSCTIEFCAILRELWQHTDLARDTEAALTFISGSAYWGAVLVRKNARDLGELHSFYSESV